MIQPIPKPIQRKRKKRTMSDKVINAVLERDGGTCQKCGDSGVHIHHIVYGGVGRRRIHRIENLITVCLSCHKAIHSSKELREWTYQWSRERYGGVIDELLRQKWSM